MEQEVECTASLRGAHHYLNKKRIIAPSVCVELLMIGDRSGIAHVLQPSGHADLHGSAE